MIKFLHLLNKEIKENKRNYMKLLKTNYDYELKINSQTKKLDDIKNDFEKYNISKKIRGEKIKENTIKNIKSQFLKKENEYLMHNFQLKDEIYSLVKLLDKNKGYFNKYKEAKKEINDNKKNVNLLRIEFNKELQDKNLEYALEKDQKEELIIKLEELEETIRELKEENDNNKRKEIETNAQILQLKIILGQKNENLKMMNEELEQYIREYEKEKHNYQNSQNSLRALENRIYNEEKQKEKESISNNNEFPI
jgi:chromosome segregation ATPase